MSKFMEKRKKAKLDRENSTQRQLADINRASGDRLSAKLAEGDTKVIAIQPMEVQAAYKNAIEIFKRVLADSPAIATYTTEELDRYLTGIISYFNESLDRNDVSTARRGVKFIKESLAMRVELNTHEQPHAQEIVDKRITAVRNRLAAIEISAKTYEVARNIDKQNKYKAELAAKFQAKYEEATAFRASHPAAAEELKNNRVGDRLTGNAEELLALTREATALNRMVESTGQIISQLSEQKLEQEVALQNQESIMALNSTLLSKEALATLSEMTEQLTKDLADREELISLLKEFGTTLAESIAYYTNLPGKGMRVVDTEMAWERMEQEMARKQEEEAAAAAIKAELEAQEHTGEQNIIAAQ